MFAPGDDRDQNQLKEWILNLQGQKEDSSSHDSIAPPVVKNKKIPYLLTMALDL